MPRLRRSDQTIIKCRSARHGAGGGNCRVVEIPKSQSGSSEYMDSTTRDTISGCADPESMYLLPEMAAAFTRKNARHFLTGTPLAVVITPSFLFRPSLYVLHRRMQVTSATSSQMGIRPCAGRYRDPAAAAAATAHCRRPPSLHLFTLLISPSPPIPSSLLTSRHHGPDVHSYPHLRHLCACRRRLPDHLCCTHPEAPDRRSSSEGKLPSRLPHDGMSLRSSHWDWDQHGRYRYHYEHAILRRLAGDYRPPYLRIDRSAKLARQHVLHSDECGNGRCGRGSRCILCRRSHRESRIRRRSVGGTGSPRSRGNTGGKRSCQSRCARLRACAASAPVVL